MSKTLIRITMSLDGYVAGPNQSMKDPLGVGGEALHDWAIELAAWKEQHGQKGGVVNASSAIMREMFENVGAVIMGRNMFGGGPGPWKSDWKGWWGENPPYHMPVFVLTHHARDPLPMQGGTTFHFVTDGIQASPLDNLRPSRTQKALDEGLSTQAGFDIRPGSLRCPPGWGSNQGCSRAPVRPPRSRRGEDPPRRTAY
jgi:dihydrofolate reductase